MREKGSGTQLTRILADKHTHPYYIITLGKVLLEIVRYHVEDCLLVVERGWT
jgi:hypothetical protein